ncbi:MAG: sigma-70 family RNA polymerase sigma factor, partial [Bacillota bacterium]|nr:sigma-70 family RNA polymerase sigma factor [Bacillota bacterium]
KALDYCRQAESHAPFRDEQGVCCSEDLPGGTHNPEESVVKLEEQAELYQKLKNLPPVYRKAIVEHYFKSRSYKEMASDENISVKTVESRIYRAKKMLKKMHGGGDINEMPVSSRSQLGGICE